MSFKNVTAKDLRDKGIPAISYGEYQDNKTVKQLNNCLTNEMCDVYAGALMELEVQFTYGRKRGNTKAYLSAVKEIVKEYDSVTAKRIEYV